MASIVNINHPAADTFGQSDYLEQIFNLQRGLLKHYIGIEGLPSYPLNIEIKSSQTLMKEFIRRGVEELAEAHEYYRDIFRHNDLNKPDGSHERLLGFNEELSDALHFFVEAFIFAGIDEYAIQNWYDGFYRDKSLPVPFPEDILATAVETANMLNTEDFGPEPLRNAFSTLNSNEIDKYPMLIGGNRVSMRLLKVQAEMLWDVVHHFSLAMNCLKNNAWKQTHTEVDPIEFRERMMMGWVALINLLVYFGHNPETIFRVYFHKNYINHQRIKSKR